MHFIDNVLQILKQEFYKKSIDFNQSSSDPEVILVDEFIKNNFPEKNWRGNTAQLAEQIVSSIVNGSIDSEKSTADTILYDVQSDNIYYSVKCSSCGTESKVYKHSPTFLRQLLLVPLYINGKKNKAKDISPIIEKLKQDEIVQAIIMYNSMYPGNLNYSSGKVSVVSKSNKYFSISAVWREGNKFHISISKPILESTLLENVFNAIINKQITFDKKCTVVHSKKSKDLIFGIESNHIEYELLHTNHIADIKNMIINRIHKISNIKLLKTIESLLS